MKRMFIPRNSSGSSKAAELRAATTRGTSMLRERVLSHCVNTDTIQLMVTEIGMKVHSVLVFLDTICMIYPLDLAYPSNSFSF